jgi:hypothetical protein
MSQPLHIINKNIEKYNRVVSYYVHRDEIYRTYKRGNQIKLQKFRFDMSEGKWRWFHKHGFYYKGDKIVVNCIYKREEFTLKKIDTLKVNEIIDNTKMLYELRR